MAAKRTVIGDRYELQLVPLGRGGMGEVWEGRDVKLDREVAVKFVRFPDGVVDDELVRRFVRESRITARLRHPGVPAVYDVGTHNDRPFLVMQRIHGISVADLVAEQGPLPIGWACAIAAQTCAVLAVAHQASLIHRDLKPSNLMLEPDGTVKVLDFGLAVAIDMADMSQITVSGQTIGTPAYMAPEQVLTTMSGPQSDLYTLGCVLHEMVTGEQVFSGPTAYSVMNKQVAERPVAVDERRPDVPPELARMIGALLEKKPDDRPASAQDVYQRLLPFVENLAPIPGALHPPSIPSPFRMYAAVVSRTFVGLGSQRASGAEASPAPRSERPRSSAGAAPEPSPTVSRSDIERARSDAGGLVKQSRFSEAADILEAAVTSASTTFAPSDDSVIDLRLDLANVLFEGGEYRRAAPAYEALARDLARRDGPDAELVLRSRLQAATSRALIGDTAASLRTLDALLADESRVYGADDPRTLELRRQIGLLQLGAGRRAEAVTTLSDLLDDLVRIHGSEHPSVAKTQELLLTIPHDTPDNPRREEGA